MINHEAISRILKSKIDDKPIKVSLIDTAKIIEEMAERRSEPDNEQHPVPTAGQKSLFGD